MNQKQKDLVTFVSAIVATGSCLVLIGLAIVAALFFPRDFFGALTNVALVLGSIAVIIGFVYGVCVLAKRIFYFFLRHFG